MSANLDSRDWRDGVLATLDQASPASAGSSPDALDERSLSPCKSEPQLSVEGRDDVFAEHRRMSHDHGEGYAASEPSAGPGYELSHCRCAARAAAIRVPAPLRRSYPPLHAHRPL